MTYVRVSKLSHSLVGNF